METLERKDGHDDLHTPYCEITLKQYSEAVPEKKKSFEIVMKEIDRQGIENFEVFQSERFPGVAFSHTKLQITPELIQKIREQTIPAHADTTDDEQTSTENQEEETNAKRHDYFLFTASAPPPDGHAFTVQDVAIDRFIRLMPRVANAIRRGENPPEVSVYLLGAPTGLGGSVTPEWLETIRQRGFEGHGELYAEFIEKQESANKKSTEVPHIVLQGVSKGAVVAEKTSKYLPGELAQHTQRLLDNPAGDHEKNPARWLKGAEVALGYTGEALARMLFDDTMKGLMKRGNAFINYLSLEKGIPKDAPEQLKLKWKATIVEVWTLIKGSSLDTDGVRSFIRRGMYDPVTFSMGRLFEIWQKSNQGKGAQFYQDGKSVEAPFRGQHMFFYNRYKRWSTILDFAEGSSDTTPARL